MKRIGIIVMIAMLSALLMSSAMASGVSGRIVGNRIVITWQAGAGTCELTVRKGNWPICARSVRGGSGSVEIAIDDPTATYTLRLKAPEGSYTARVEGAKPAATRAPVSVSNRDDLATQVLNLLNGERASRGLPELRMDPELTRAACVRAGEIARSFSHTRPDGSAWSTVSGAAYGENIARGQNSAEKVIAAWMTSANHRENMLRASYGSVGICAYKVGGVMHWVQLFGK
ncbi:MAG: CAP domain-containing protein [Clostridia bacterium]|nr:CAP domain-containing protein [Clostridia bacterium]